MNTRTPTVLVGLLLASGLSACGDPGVESEPAADLRDGSSESTEPLADGGDGLVAAVCNGRVMVARREDHVCESGGGWTADRLFPNSNSSTMEQFCRYTWSDPNTLPGQQAINGLVQSVGLQGDVASDCQAVTPEADAIGEVIGPEMRELFYWSAGKPKPADLLVAYPNATQSPVTVAVVDTYPSHEPANPISTHGPIVASLVEAFACPGGSCPVDVTHSLGLPRVDGAARVSPARGGVLGMQSDLAFGIYDAVENAPDPEHLVINLSVGWDASLFGGDGSSAPPPSVAAVETALEFARCSGALIVVAAGNHGGLRCDEQALAPARWEEAPAPDASTCTDLVGPVHATFGGPYEPLVYAVGGLNWAGGAMPGTRQDGIPRLSAAATRAPAEPRAGLHEPVVRTGTSMAAAAVSGTAGLLWSLDPTLSPAGVMGKIYNSGNPVGAQLSDFGPNGGGDPVHALDVCRAIRATCGASSCGAPGTGGALDCDQGVPITTDELFEMIEDAAIEGPPNPIGGVAESCGEICGSERFVYGPPNTTVACEEHEPNPQLRFTNPQPTRPGCEDCGVTVEPSGDAVAHLTLNGDFDAYPIESGTVDVRDVTGEIHSFVLNEEDLTAPPTSPAYMSRELSSTTIEDVTIELSVAGITPVSVSLSLKFTDELTTEDPMIMRYE